MKILFVYPTRLDKQGQPLKYKKAFFPPLSLAILDSLTPAHHTVRIVNDIAEPIDFSGDYDLVGITAMTAQSERAYQIADTFRSRGVKVVLGGIHPSVLPQEAKVHADAVVIGEAEHLWEQILDDCEQNTLKDFYHGTTFPPLQQLVIPRWDHMNLNIYPKPFGSPFPDMPFFASRGCPFGCKFCSVTKFFGKRYRTKPIGNVLREIDSLNAVYRFFVDDNITCDTDYARELFQLLAKRKQKFYWVSQISTLVLKTPELLDLAARAGCTGLIVGVESLNKASLKSVNKGFNNVDQYAELFVRMRKLRITPLPNFIFGFDEDTLEQFQLTLEFLRKHHIRDALFWILTPYPGTEIFAEMEQEGRLEHRRWSLFDAAHVVFRLRNVSPQQLSESYWKTYQAFYSLKNLIDFALHSRMRHVLPNLLGKTIIRKKIYACEHPTAFGVGKWELPIPGN